MRTAICEAIPCSRSKRQKSVGQPKTFPIDARHGTENRSHFKLALEEESARKHSEQPRLVGDARTATRRIDASFVVHPS
ncbi:hypothetical protein Q31a_37610 [Aureliella helgolandensis]|uniref:Uncharacterized protein n=1 Tax=Aureliella helgolandensis TaxID=2527968 RepID=A0A518GA12_9BACT|nr:hypothetical protein Q31a_37610 [Aureliella helgolandensis]